MLYPALSIVGADSELVLAIADDHSPTAAESSGSSVTLFFRSARARDAAQQAIVAAFPAAALEPHDVDDEDWARRSQEHLTPVSIGRLIVYPSLRDLRLFRPSPEPRVPSPVSIIIQPSMGFGTGHHATTRLCLLALQREELAEKTVLDVGTGSGILAIAAACLGAAHAVGIDNDPDAIQAARENLALNPQAAGVVFEVGDVSDGVRLNADAAASDIVIANLTGALLAREARRLVAAARPGGRLIVSGLLAAERDQVLAALRPAENLWEGREEEWVALTFRAPNGSP